MRAGEVAIAFFETEDVAFRVSGSFEKRDLFTDEFEAGQGAAQIYTKFFSDRGNHIGRDNGSDSDRILRHGALFRAETAQVIQQQYAHFVAGDKTVIALSVRAGSAHTVAVRVGTDQKVSALFTDELQPQFHCFADLRIRIRAGGEVTVRLLLFGNDGDVFHAHLVQQHPDTFQTGAVQRGVDQLQVGDIIARAQRQDRVHEVFQTFVRDILDESGCFPIVIAHLFDIGESVGFLTGFKYL